MDQGTPVTHEMPNKRRPPATNIIYKWVIMQEAKFRWQEGRTLAIYMYTCKYICICIYVYIYTYVYVYMYTYIYTYIYTCMYICMHVCMYVCLYVCMSVCLYVYVLFFIFYWFCKEVHGFPISIEHQCSVRKIKIPKQLQMGLWLPDGSPTWQWKIPMLTGKTQPDRFE